MTAPRFITVLLVCLALGCNGEKPRVPVYGQVKLRGYPIRGGNIAFTPDRERGYRGPMTRVDVGLDGKFRVNEGGLAPGWYRITVASIETPLASRFQDPDLAGLEREVVAGRENSWEIELQ